MDPSRWAFVSSLLARRLGSIPADQLSHRSHDTLQRRPPPPDRAPRRCMSRATRHLHPSQERLGPGIFKAIPV